MPEQGHRTPLSVPATPTSPRRHKYQARPTIYEGVPMRSRLEAGFAQWWESAGGGHWDYEPHAFAGPEGQYLPDFRLDRVAIPWEMRHAVAYVEVKPKSFDPRGPAGRQVARAMSLILDSEPDAVALLATPSYVGRLNPAEDFEDFDGVVCHIEPTFIAQRWLNVVTGIAVDSHTAAHAIDGPWQDDYWAVA